MTMKRLIFALTTTLALWPLQVVAANLQLSDYVGVWRGKGSFERVAAIESNGNLTCKMTIKATSINELNIKGLCATPGGAEGFSLRITASGDQLTGEDGKNGRKSVGLLTASGFKLTGKDKLGETLFALSAPDKDKMRWTSFSKSNLETRSASAILMR